MVHATFMRSLNTAITACVIGAVNASVELLGKFNVHCFLRGGAQHRVVKGRSKCTLDVVKWWGVLGCSDNMNTIVSYLLE